MIPQGTFVFPGERIELTGKRLRITVLHTADAGRLRERTRKSRYLRTDIVLTWANGREVVLPARGRDEARCIHEALTCARETLGKRQNVEVAKQVEDYAPNGDATIGDAANACPLL